MPLEVGIMDSMHGNTGECFTKLVAASDKIKKLHEFYHMEMFLCSFYITTVVSVNSWTPNGIPLRIAVQSCHQPQAKCVHLYSLQENWNPSYTPVFVMSLT